MEYVTIARVDRFPCARKDEEVLLVFIEERKILHGDLKGWVDFGLVKRIDRLIRSVC